jgi:hypothetical protein
VAGRIKLNLGVVLIGRPALRKSSAISFSQRFASNLSLNYGPTDTGGARHGIMHAMQNRLQEDIKDDSPGQTKQPLNLRDFALSEFTSTVARVRRNRTRPSSIYFASKELGRLLTSPTRELLDFFADGLDGEAIFYQTKNGNVRLSAPLINLLGATTPGSLSNILPRDAHDHGFLSRLIFVYGAKNERSVPLPPSRTEQEIEVEAILSERLEQAVIEAEGEITFTPEAAKEYTHLYNYSVITGEFRLNAYAGRRAIHLVRVAAIICLLRGESPYQVSREDLGLAHVILILTEIDMDAAYMGMNKTIEARAYVLMREILESLGPEEGDHLRMTSHLMKAGWTEQEVIHIFDVLTRMNKIRGEGGRLKIAESMGVEKAGQYIDRLIKIRQGG